jgi:hypothetical protein
MKTGSGNQPHEVTREIVHTEEQLAAAAAAAAVMDAARLGAVYDEPSVCIDCYHTTTTVGFSKANIHVCCMKSCRRTLHSNVLCPAASMLLDDKYYCRQCISGTPALSFLMPSLSPLPDSPSALPGQAVAVPLPSSPSRSGSGKGARVKTPSKKLSG